MGGTSVGKVKVKSKKSSNSLLFPVTKKKSCFNFQSPLSGPTDFNFSILPIPDVFGLKATAFSAAGKERSGFSLAHCPVRAASACSGSSPLPRRHVGTLSVCGGRSSETDPFEVDTVEGVDVSTALVGQPRAAERLATAHRSKCGRGAVSSGSTAHGRGETDFLELDPVVGMGRSAVAAGHAASSGSIAHGRGETDLLKLDPVVGVGWNADAAGQAGSRSVSRMQSDLCLNSRIHGSQSSCFACARVSSGALLGACVVGSASGALGSACLPAVRTRTYADVAASACGGMAVMQRHACNSVVSGGFLLVQKSTSYDVGTCREGGAPKVGFSVWPKICTLSQREAGVNFRPAGRVQVKQGKCGHTFPPPGGSWFSVCVAWTRQENQAIDGLDECVRDHTIGDLGAKG